MKRRTFIQSLLVLAASPVLPAIAKSEELTNQDIINAVIAEKNNAIKAGITAQANNEAEVTVIYHDIWQEDPKTVDELYSCVNKYCNHIYKINTAYSISLGKDKAPVTYALGYKGFIKEGEKNLIRAMWWTLRSLIATSTEKRPDIIWRRAPSLIRENDITSITARTYISGSTYSSYMEKKEGEEMTLES